MSNEPRSDDPLLERLLTKAEELESKSANAVEGEEALPIAMALSPRRRLPRLPERYRDEGRLGAGGMGEVRLVRDIALRRSVAMKILSPASSASPLSVQTFVEEARAVGQLEHPHIPPVYELGADEAGVAYFSMKVVKGVTLWERMRKQDWAPGSAERLKDGIEILLKVCDALAFAHSRGVIHRDVKSDNIMIGDYGEVFLMDWGLAKIRREATKLDVPRPAGSPLDRVVEGVLGTMAYMPPEQAMAGALVDQRSDVFGVGAVLYELLTGQYLYPGHDEELVLEQVRNCAFKHPLAAAPDVFIPRQIVGVVLKALARDPGERYENVLALKHDLQRFLHGGLYLPRVVFAPGEVIIHEGEASDSAYIVMRGECEAYKTVNGERRVLRRMGARSVFGEAAVVSNMPRTASVAAVTEVTLLRLSPQTIEDGLSGDRWENLLVQTLIERFREMEARLAELEGARLSG